MYNIFTWIMIGIYSVCIIVMIGLVHYWQRYADKEIKKRINAEKKIEECKKKIHFYEMVTGTTVDVTDNVATFKEIDGYKTIIEHKRE